MKKMIVMLTIFAALVVASPRVESADWILNCTVNGVGAGADHLSAYVPIQLTCPGYTIKNFSILGADMSAKNRVLATVLTALSTEKPVMVYVDNMASDPVGIYVVLVNQ